MVVLKLYVAGASVRSERAIANIRQIRDTYLGEQCVVHVVDVLQRPEEAETAHIMATPTLVREEPKPERRIIGDLSDTQTVLKTLNISSNGSAGADS